MPPSILSDDTGGLRPSVPGPSAIAVIAVLWVTFACVMPLYQLREARRQAHQDLLRILATDRSDNGSLIAAFDRSNKGLDAAASGPCLILAVTSIALINQILKLKRRYNTLARGLSTLDQRQSDAD